ncbi:MAG TPA: hypothetical protein VFF77_08460 [Holophagaceae bacterium]|nr:hypothetical protein [Holophagaceae bacterium]
MALDASWDNSGLPPQRKGMPTWLKVLAGCGILMVLAIGSCVGFAAWGLHKVSDMGKAQWPRYVETVKELQDPASTKAVYEANPRLQKRFPDEAAFEQQVAEWRPALQTPPDEMPSITTGRAIAFEGRNHEVRFGAGSGEAPSDGRKTSMAGYKMKDGRMFVIVWQDDGIIEINFEHRDRR